MTLFDPTAYTRLTRPSFPLGLAIILVMQVSMWLYAYKNEEGIGAAIFTGFLLFILVIPQLLIPQVTDQPSSMTVMIVFSYLGVSHWAYAIAIYRMNQQSWFYRYKK